MFTLAMLYINMYNAVKVSDEFPGAAKGRQKETI